MLVAANPDDVVTGIADEVDEMDAATAGVYAGCGIVGASDPAEELAETRAKLRPVLGALGAE